MTLYELEALEAKFLIEANRTEGGFQITAGGKTFLLRLERADDPRVLVARFADKPMTVILEEADGRRVTLIIGGERLTFEKPLPVVASVQPTVPTRTTSKDLLASPMPGRIISISVKEGDAVKAGDAVAIIESMKMESVVRSDHDVHVGEVLVTEGSTVKRGQALFKFSTEERS